MIKTILFFTLCFLSCSKEIDVAGTTVGTGNPSPLPEPVPTAKVNSTTLVWENHHNLSKTSLRLRVFNSNYNPLLDSVPELDIEISELDSFLVEGKIAIPLEKLIAQTFPFSDSVNYHLLFEKKGKENNQIYYSSNFNFFPGTQFLKSDTDTLKELKIHFSEPRQWQGKLAIEPWFYEITTLVFKGSPFYSALDDSGRFTFNGIPPKLDSLVGVQEFVSPSSIPCDLCLDSIINGQLDPSKGGFEKEFLETFRITEFNIGDDTLKIN